MSMTPQQIIQSRRCALHARAAFRVAAGVTARQQQLRVDEILSPSGRPPRSARLIAAYLTATVFDVPTKRLAQAIGLRRSGLQRALRRIEDRRDDPAFDAMLGRLEQMMGEGVAA